MALYIMQTEGLGRLRKHRFVISNCNFLFCGLKFQGVEIKVLHAAIFYYNLRPLDIVIRVVKGSRCNGVNNSRLRYHYIHCVCTFDKRAGTKDEQSCYLGQTSSSSLRISSVGFQINISCTARRRQVWFTLTEIFASDLI